MRMRATFVVTATLLAGAAGAQVPGSLTPTDPAPGSAGLPTSDPAHGSALGGLPPATPPGVVAPPTGLPSLPASPGGRPGAGRASAGAGPSATDRPAGVEQNPRMLELERKSREIDRRVMRSICTGC